jgi:hypothetical protein
MFHSLTISLLIFLRRLKILRELKRVVSEMVTVIYITLYSKDESFIPTISLPDRFKGAKRRPFTLQLTDVGHLLLTFADDLAFRVPLYHILELTVVLCLIAMKDTSESIARGSFGASPIADNIKSFSQRPSAEPAIAVV